MNVRVLLRCGLAALVAAVVVLPLAAAGAAPTSALTRVSQDTIVDGIALHQSEQQAQLAAAPGSQTIVGVFQVGRIYDGGASAIGWSTSVNSGKSWKHGLVPLTVAPGAGGPTSGLGPIYRGADPVVAYNARYHKWLVVSRGLNGITGVSQGLYENTSANGSTWSQPSSVHAGGTGDTPDKPSVTCDNTASSGGYGNCYLAYTNTSSTNPASQLLTQRSTDGGVTWSAPVANTGDTATTTLSAATAVGATNIRVASVANLTVGQTLVVDSGGANPETVTITSVGTAGAGGTGVNVAPALAFAHATGATVTENNVPATGTGAVALVQSPAAGAPASTCGRVVVSYAGGGGISSLASSDCGVTYGPHAVVATTFAATHTVAQGLRTSLLPSASMDKNGAIYLVWQTRGFRLTQTTLSAPANPGDTNIKVGSVTGMVAGNTLKVENETVTITTVGTAGAAGTGVTFAPALASAHATGAFVTVNGIFSTSTAAPNDIALAVMPGATAATPAPSFAAPTRIAIEADQGATSNTVDHFIPAIAADPNGTGKLALYYAFYPISACAYVTGQPLDNTLGGPQCMPNEGYVSSTNGGSSWSAPQTLASMRSLAVIPRSNTGPDLGNVQGAVVAPFGPLKGQAFGLFPVGINVGGIDESLYVPSHGLAIASGS